ncbi:MAG TPA: tyrosine--tRNA ligase [Thermoplasmata archaeon]|nr:tyrosine--tRNA ligase [Thermoplasmata archaeon]
MDTGERVERVTRHTLEVLTREEVAGLFERSEHPRAYIGFEPSGQLTIGHLITARKMRDLQEAGCDLTVFLADWHAWINDKLDGSLERIEASGRYMEHAFTALGVDASRARFRWAHELSGSSDYWSRVVRVAKATSLSRTRRAMTVLGRGEEEEQLDTAKLFYPAMQVADIFELPVDLAYAGLDQRRAHVLAREVAHHYGWPVPVAVHTPLLSSLKGGGRMDLPSGTVERKMSKSDPGSAIVIPSTPSEIADRIAGAFCPAKEVDGNPVVEVVRDILFPWEGRFHVERPAKYGGAVDFESASAFLDAWKAGSLHPGDLKPAAAEALARVVAPATKYFEAHPQALEWLASAGGKRSAAPGR